MTAEFRGPCLAPWLMTAFRVRISYLCISFLVLHSLVGFELMSRRSLRFL